MGDPSHYCIYCTYTYNICYIYMYSTMYIYTIHILHIHIIYIILIYYVYIMYMSYVYILCLYYNIYILYHMYILYVCKCNVHIISYVYIVCVYKHTCIYTYYITWICCIPIYLHITSQVFCFHQCLRDFHTKALRILALRYLGLQQGKAQTTPTGRKACWVWLWNTCKMGWSSK